MNWIKKETKRRTALYRRRFLHAKPFRHVVIPEAFHPTLLRQVRKALHSESFKKMHSETSRGAFLRYFEAKNPFLKNCLPSFFKEMLPWVESITQMKFSRLRVGMDFYRYHKADYLNVHRDSGPFYAVVFIVNLTNFSLREGGRLMLLDSPTPKRERKRSMTKYIPHRFNNLILFQAGRKSFHQMEPFRTNNDKERLTMGGAFFKSRCDYPLVQFLKKSK